MVTNKEESLGHAPGTSASSILCSCRLAQGAGPQPLASASVACCAPISSEMSAALVLGRVPPRGACNRFVEPGERLPESARFVTRVENQAAVPSTP